MKRRQFLKSVFGAVAGVVAVPSVVKPSVAISPSERMLLLQIQEKIANPPLYLYKGTESMLKLIPTKEIHLVNGSVIEFKAYEQQPKTFEGMRAKWSN